MEMRTNHHWEFPFVAETIKCTRRVELFIPHGTGKEKILGRFGKTTGWDILNRTDGTLPLSIDANLGVGKSEALISAA